MCRSPFLSTGPAAEGSSFQGSGARHFETGVYVKMGLNEVYRPYFPIGAAVPAAAFDHPAALRAIASQYGSMTCENDMKPEALLDREENQRNPAAHDRSPAVCFDGVRKYLDFAKEHGIGMRGHTLVWHNQTPRWFFAKDYRAEEDAPLADRETMLARLDSYIQSVMTFAQTEYPGVIYAWDVVNEAIDGGALRSSLWTQTVGEDFVLQAFRMAARWKAPGVSLFYNDYDTFLPEKREAICEIILAPLLAEGLIDGMGMQSHVQLETPSLEEYREAVRRYGALGLQVQITELDVFSPDTSEAAMRRLAERYRDLFTVLLEAKREGAANVTGVTFWGLQDEESWLTGFRRQSCRPLLFERSYRPKEAYQAVCSVPGRVEGDLEDRLPGGQRFAFWEREQTYTKEYHVNPAHPNASDENDGSADHPLRTIQAAADRVGPGERVWIHGGVYRECVRPRRGGEGPDRMVCYEAFGDGDAVIKASVEAKEFRPSVGWERTPHGAPPAPDSVRIWETRLNPEEFKGYNPFCAVNILHDRLFIEYDKTDMTPYLNRRGMVFCDGKPLRQVALYNQMTQTPGSYWVEANGQTVHFRLADDGDPQYHVIELTCREQCFAPETPFLSYIKVKGLVCAHAATGAPVPQRGSISCFRGHHWVIENCVIDWSNAVGIDVGNECWHHTIEENQIIGHTVVRGCEIRDAGVCGIAGLFATHMLIEDNRITGTGWQGMELSWEAGGIKVHNSVNSLIRRNVFAETFRADHLWMDVGNENNRITRNLFLDGREQREAIFIECSRDGINLIDNNIFWNVEGRFRPEDVPKEPGSTGWYKMEEHGVVNGYAVYGEGTDRLHVEHNLIGRCRSAGYYVKPVAFRISGPGSRGGTGREARIRNNLFYDCGEAAIKFPTRDNDAQGNAYIQMPGGYLRVLYPAPETCLHLDAWQEFYGFDREGQEGWFTICVDTERLTLEMKKPEQPPRVDRLHPDRMPYVTDPEQLQAVQSSLETPEDFYGAALEDRRMPGPFASLKAGCVYSIDPRRKECKK